MTNLPQHIPVFPLAGAVLLPGGYLPLNIFEPRYVAMIEDALAGDKIIGMIQPRRENMSCGSPHLQSVGCAGEIAEYEIQQDGRYLVVLSGLSRFKVQDELPPLRGYRRVAATWLQEPDGGASINRQRLIPALKHYLQERGIDCDWSAASCCPDDKLITTLAMICPFTSAEQQALLEANSLAERSELLTSLLEIPCPDCAKKH